MMNEKCYVPLFDFQTLFDTDFGIMSLIGAEYLDSGIFDPEWFHQHNTNKALVKALYERVDINPLVQATVEGIEREEIDELYQSFYNNKEIYKKVLKRSTATEHYRLFWGFQNNGDIYPYILYYCEEELEFLKAIPDFEVIPPDRLININDFIMKPKQYKFILQFYCKLPIGKYIESIVSFLQENRDGIYRVVYIADYPFNMEDVEKQYLLRTPGILAIYTMNHTVRSIGLYNRLLLEDKDDNRSGKTGEEGKS